MCGLNKVSNSNHIRLIKTKLCILSFSAQYVNHIPITEEQQKKNCVVIIRTNLLHNASNNMRGSRGGTGGPDPPMEIEKFT